ncbi:MAG: zinc ribbon domain-containing protein [Clostridiales Family XIII bacterium]|jgi:RNA polymerase subunit RPABC4/transcription elongation factor Spt4|nr:zinc ribbon domain-containing protein [Clostridiales Family XIII bacterium]
MGIFDDVGKKITTTGNSALQKTKEMAETMKINSRISSEQAGIDSAYREIGRIYFEKFGDNPDGSMEQYISSIRRANENIQAYRQNLIDIKGSVQCPSCGAEVDNRSKFCNVCGAEIVSRPTGRPEDGASDTAMKTCVNCGAQMSADNSFCTNCGTKQDG